MWLCEPAHSPQSCSCTRHIKRFRTVKEKSKYSSGLFAMGKMEISPLCKNAYYIIVDLVRGSDRCCGDRGAINATFKSGSIHGSVSLITIELKSGEPVSW
jgi:hypothetical protein